MFPRHPSHAANQGTDDLALALGYQEGGRGIRHELSDVLEAVRGACVLAPNV
jgi:hypothetical protein